MLHIDGPSGSMEKSLPRLCNQFCCPAQGLDHHAHKASGHTRHQTGGQPLVRALALIQEGPEGVVRYATDGPEKGEAYPAEAVGQALAKSLRPRPPHDLIALAVLRIKRKDVEVT